MREFATGWHPSLPDLRDAPYEQKLREEIKAGPLPRYVDRHHECPPIWNQGRLGSCTGHGSSAGWAQDRHKLGQEFFEPSRLFAYYNARAEEGTTQTDAGATVRDVIKGIAKWGLPPQELWPYDTSKFALKPPQAAYNAAAAHTATEYNPVTQNLDYMKAVLADGYVIVFGFTIYQSFYRANSPRTGLITMPSGKALGGHCVAAVGYNSKSLFCLRNSWGTDNGDPNMPGHYWMPPEYITHPMLAGDFWVIRTVQS